jgi:hypothetical protein
MSFKVLVIPEDQTYNGAILKPLVRRILTECGKPQAKVDFPQLRLRGFDDAVRQIPGIVDRYSHVDLLLFIADADGKDRTAVFARLEREATDQGVRLLCCAAQQEIEAWVLAGHVEQTGRTWQEIRNDVSVKENVFEPFLASRADLTGRVAGGRDVLMEETLRNCQGLPRHCPELMDFQRRICEAVAPTPDGIP